MATRVSELDSIVLATLIIGGRGECGWVGEYARFESSKRICRIASARIGVGILYLHRYFERVIEKETKKDVIQFGYFVHSTNGINTLNILERKVTRVSHV
jgi:hypothetical protein